MSKQIGRLAYREEGLMWNAYYALPGTMDGALHLGGIKMTLVLREDRKQQFMELMQEAFSDMTEELWGQRATFPDAPQRAPEHERAGHS